MSESHQFIQLVKIMINDTRIVDVNTSSPFHIAITKITAAASNPITDIAVDIFLFLSNDFDFSKWLTIWIFSIENCLSKKSIHFSILASAFIT